MTTVETGGSNSMDTVYEPGTEIAECDPPDNDLSVVHGSIKSAGDYRTESVAQALDAAYSRASTLVLTEVEADKLAEDFPDEAFRRGAQGNNNLIYIEHAYLRQRLNQVLGVGASVPVRRREWSERWDYVGEDGKEHPAIRIYVDLVLLVRGCVVGEAIGDAVYYPDNGMTNYSDALESAKSAALRRCCKEFGVGLQAWMKGWVDGWKQRNGSQPKSNNRPAKPPTKKPENKMPPTRLTEDTDLAAWERHDAGGYLVNVKKSGELLAFLDRITHVPEWTSNVPDWTWLCQQITAAYRNVIALDHSQVNPPLIERLKQEHEKLKGLADDPFGGEPAA